MSCVYLLKSSTGKNCYLILVFASIFLVSFGIFAHNAFADKVVDTIQLPKVDNSSIKFVGVNPATNMIYAVGENFAHKIYIINGTTDSASTLQIGTASTELADYNVGVNPNTNMIYVGNGEDSGSLTVLDGSTNSVVAKPLNDSITSVAVNPVTNKIYVADGTLGQIVVIDGSTNTIINKIPESVSGIAVNPNTNKIYAVLYSSVSVIDGATDTIIGNINLGAIVDGIGINPNTNRIYVSDTGGLAFQNPHIAVIDGSTNSVITTIAKFHIVGDIAVNSDTNKIYLPKNSTAVAIIDGSTNNVTSTILVGNNPLGVGVNQVTNKMYVADQEANTVSVIQGDAPPPTTTSQLQVNSQDNNGTITGFYNELYASNGTLLDAGYTPNNFTLNNGETYSVHAANYGKYMFSHWQDTGFTNANRTISITSDGTITAVYKTVPQPPTGLAATAVSSSQMNLTWNAPTNNGGSPVTSYEIKRSVAGSTWSVLVRNTHSTSTTYSDTGLQPNTQYSYRVFAINDVGTSLRSNTALNTTSDSTGSTAPQPPSSLKAFASSSSQIDLSWNAPGNNGGSAITGYDIQRSTDNGNTWSTLVQDTGTTDTTYADTGLAADTAYTYQVSAINSVGTSQPSNTATAITSSTSTGSPGITVYAHRIQASYWDPCFATSCSAGTGPGALMYFELWDSSGNFLQDGYADENGYTFPGLDPSATYYVYPDNCNRCHGSNHNVVFQYWGDDSSNTRPRAATVGTSLDAWYSCTNGCAGR